ncbi:2Fe-2S iron-sulfur cluster-binding protein [Thalassotalea psychrophila]|uniref:2Fe-2S iron-sulfur cluster-binding protein n=1 Tax=Thalassotalea psychrophila TaxID=3065647 RepID=A0ABY9TZ98_9GAMM|nr:2Fe-2S iron-sulfur cluster-binding protein [Colwelliaceae bacterium SQ149]
MASCKATLNFSDHSQAEITVKHDETLLEAAQRQDINLPNSCREGTCGSCLGNCKSGKVTLSGQAIALTTSDKERGRILPCQLTLQGDAEFSFDFSARICQPSDDTPFMASVAKLTPVADGAVLLSLQVELLQQLDFQAGQYIDIKVPGTESWRSYSFVNLPNAANNIDLLLRILPKSANGIMSSYLRDRVELGDRLLLRRGGGAFYLRDVKRPVVLVAGGTGLSAIVSQLRQLVDEKCQHPVNLLYGAAKPEDLCLLDEIESLGRQLPHFRLLCAVAEGNSEWQGKTGFVTDLLVDVDLHDGNCDVYLCGPPLMIDGVQKWFADKEITDKTFTGFKLYHEKFAASGRDGRIAVPPVKPKYRAEIPKKSGTKFHRHAVVIGGSMAGMMAAKTLSKFFDKVTVLERDSHHPMETEIYRPSTSQAHHAHHLLQGGQRVVNDLFPDYTDDFAKAGGNVVDASRDYRMYTNDGWKVVYDSGISVCAGRRSLLEGVMRQQLEKTPSIDYRYNAKVEDVLIDQPSNRITGVVLKEGLNPKVENYTLEADLVVDASGKNTPLPALLNSHGYSLPRESHMELNCLYTTVLYRVPEHLRNSDFTVMAIANHRPQETDMGYAGFYGDGSTLLVTTIQLFCDQVPRDHAAFKAVTKGLAQPHIYELVNACEPITEPESFNYPTMVRNHYEEMNSVPEGFVCVGDAFASADPVSGAGMTKAAKEVELLGEALVKSKSSLTGLPAYHYKQASKLVDSIWFVLGEQNYRFPHVEGKRPIFTPVINWYVDQVMDATHYDPVAFENFMHVYHHNKHYSSLFAPAMVAKILKHSVTKNWRHVYNPAPTGVARSPLKLD